jgi:folate-binding protein YgfZ
MEINDDTNPFELGLTQRVHLAKGCYVGQETLAKLATYDGVRRQLRRWHCPQGAIDLGEIFASGQVLRDAEGERAGQITSSLPLGRRAGSVLPWCAGAGCTSHSCWPERGQRRWG